jgi:hypothetical protein
MALRIPRATLFFTRDIFIPLVSKVLSIAHLSLVWELLGTLGVVPETEELFEGARWPTNPQNF